MSTSLSLSVTLSINRLRKDSCFLDSAECDILLWCNSFSNEAIRALLHWLISKRVWKSFEVEDQCLQEVVFRREQCAPI